MEGVVEVECSRKMTFLTMESGVADSSHSSQIGSYNEYSRGRTTRKKAGIDKYTSAAARVDPRRYLPAMEWDSHPKTRK